VYALIQALCFAAVVRPQNASHLASQANCSSCKHTLPISAVLNLIYVVLPVPARQLQAVLQSPAACIHHTLKLQSGRSETGCSIQLTCSCPDPAVCCTAAVVCAGISVACLDKDIEDDSAAPSSACRPLPENAQCSFDKYCQQGFCGGAHNIIFGCVTCYFYVACDWQCLQATA
jgi:hypothetical protein